MSSILVQVIVGGLLLGAVYALFSSGLTLIWGMMNIVNFAHGDFVMLGMYVAFVVWTLLGVGPFLGAPVAALVLATLGIIVYFGLIRSVMKGPMLAQILGTFGLALLLRYSVFWGFGANFMTLPENLVGGTFDVLGIRIQASRLLAGVVALLVTLGLHLLLTRTSLGSKMFAVAEDSTAAQLMGIRPDTMQAIAWAIAAGATGIAGALIATFFYIAPTVGETLGIVAFVTVSLGGFGSVPGALVAGLLIGVIESVSAYWIGAVYKDIVVYSLFLGLLWFRPQCLMGNNSWARGNAAFYLAFGRARAGDRVSAAVLNAVPAAAWGAGAALCDRGVGVEHRRRLCRPGIGRTCGVLRVRRLCVDGGVFAFRAAAAGRNSRRHHRQRIDRRRDRGADAAAVGTLFQHGDHRGGRTRQVDRHQYRISRRRRRPQRSDPAAHGARPLVHLGAALLLPVPRGARDHARHHLVDGEQPDGILSARDQGFRARGPFARRARPPHTTLPLHAERRAYQRRRCALFDDVRFRRSGIRIGHPDLGEDADHGSTRRRWPAVRTLGGRGDSGAAGGSLQQPLGRQGRGPDFCGVRRHHRVDRAVSAGRHFDIDQSAVGAAEKNTGDASRGGSHPCSLKRAT